MTGCGDLPEAGRSPGGPLPQVPGPGEVVLDHIGLFTADMDAAASAMARLGFRLTPFTPQRHALGPGEPVVAAGTGNRLAMLRQGYLEVLTSLADTPLAAQLRRALERYAGLHLIAFGTGDAEATHAALAVRGFAPIPLVRLERTIAVPVMATIGGAPIESEAKVRFSVVRVPPERMAEGRVQFCQHHTPELVWQARWLDHPNHAEALSDVLLCVADPTEAALRFGRFVERTPQRLAKGGWVLRLDRGRLAFLDPAALRTALPAVEPLALPFIAGFAVTTIDLDATRAALAQGRVDFHEPMLGVLIARAPPPFATTVAFATATALPPWLT